MEADGLDLIVREKPFKGRDGRIRGNRVAIRRDIITFTEKGCVLAEELGHHHTSVGNILDQNDVRNRKQELQARAWAYNKLIGLAGIIRSYERSCINMYEMAEYLEVTEEFLMEALEYYRHKYGYYAKLDNYVIYFEPNLRVLKFTDQG